MIDRKRLRELAQTAMSATYGRKFVAIQAETILRLLDALEQVTADARRCKDAVERIVGMCDCEDGHTGLCRDCGRPNGIPAIVMCAKQAIDAALVRGEREK